MVAAYRDAFGADARPAVLWSALPQGQSFVAGSQGDVYLFLVEVPDGLEQSKREQVMMTFVERAAEAFGIEVTKPMVSALDTAKVAEYLAGNRNRLRWWRRPGFLLGTLWHAMRTKRRLGYGKIRANL